MSTSTPPSSSASPQPTQAPPGETVPLTAAPSPTAALVEWRVDVVNGARAIVVRFNADYDAAFPTDVWSSNGFFWLVGANQHVTLFDEMTVPQRGTVDLLQTFDDRPQLGHCYVFQTVPFGQGSFTIVISGKSSGPDYSANIEPGIPAPLATPAPADMTYANCSG